MRKWRSRFVARRMAGLADAPRPGRRKAELVLSEAERAQLTRWARRAKTAQYLALRAKIVLQCAEGGMNKQVAAELGVSEQSVNRWRARFIARRLDGRMDECRPGRPPSIMLDQVEDVVIATLESTPDKDTHWSRASMAARTGLSKSTIGWIWKRVVGDLRRYYGVGLSAGAVPFTGSRFEHLAGGGDRPEPPTGSRRRTWLRCRPCR
ncbi:helix-turn-helix domain-containing protein [Streptomyces orinoci]|uniref:helix-turn-helix domain-containing protein n=1 Tax=Streptomyces orinoci TaxID=67339 RepID=UPI003BABB00C